MEGWLGRARAEEIASDLLGTPGVTFACHETTTFEEDDDGEEVYNPKGDEQHCCGAMILIDREDVPNQMLQIAQRLGLRDPGRIAADAPVLVFEDGEAFIAHHGKEFDPGGGK